jgi:hypothetical protein
MKETNLGFYNVMAVPTFLYGSKTWRKRIKNVNKIQE